MNRILRSGFYIVLGVAALLSTLRGIVNAERLSQDFQWSPARLFLEGENPYTVFLDGNADGDIILSQVPNYLHQLYVVFLPLAAMDFTSAKIVWAVANVAIGVLLALVLARHFGLGRPATYILLTVFLCSTPFRNGIGNGQHALFALVFLILPFLQLRGGYVLQGLGYSKYSFAPPFFLYNLFHDGLRKAGLGLVLPLLGLIAFSLWTGTSAIVALTQPLMVASGAVGLGNADVMSVLEAAFGVGTVVSGLAALALAAALSFLVAREKDIERHLPLVCLVSLATFKHLGYDFVFLLPVLAFSMMPGSPGRRLPIWIGVGWFWFGQKLLSAASGFLPITLDTPPYLSVGFNFLILLAMIAALTGWRMPRGSSSGPSRTSTETAPARGF